MVMAARTVEIAVTGNTRDLEAKLRAAGLVAEESGNRIGDAFTKGTSKAGGALHGLASIGATFGLPLTGSLDAVGHKLDEAHTKTGKLTTALAELGKATTIAGAAGLAAVGVEAVKLGEKFQTATASIAANAGITTDAADKIGKAFLDTAGHSVFSGNEMSQAFAQVAGQLKVTEGHALGTGEALKIMKVASDLAEASGQSLGASTSALSQLMQAYHLSVGQAAQGSDVLFNVSKSLNLPVDQVATSMGKLHGRLGVLAPSMKDVGGLMVALAQHGITGSRGMNIVNSALQTLVGGGGKSKEVLAALGVHIFNAQGKFVGLGNVIQQLHPKLAGLTQQQQLFAAKALFGAGASQVLSQVVASGVPAFDKAREAASKAGAAHDAAEKQAKTLHHQMELLKSAAEDLGTKFGLFLIPKVTWLATALADSIKWLGKHKDAAIALAAVIAGVLGPAVIVFAVQKMQAFVGGVRTGITTLGEWVLGLKGAGGAANAAAAETAAADARITEANAAAAASYRTLAAAADTGALGAGMASTATAVEAADGRIVAANNAAKASFLGILGVAGGLGYVLADLGNSMDHMPPGVHDLNGLVQWAKQRQGNIQSAGGSAAGGSSGSLGGVGGDVAGGVTGAFKGHGGGHGGTVTASTFGGSDGDKIGSTRYGFAELSHPGTRDFSALGNLPRGTLIRVTYGGRSIVIPKVDVGTGGAGLGGHQRAIDLTQSAARALGFNGLGNVSYEVLGRPGSGGAGSAIDQLMNGAGGGSGVSGGHAQGVAALGIPAAVTTMLATARALLGTSYKWGGGHSGWDPVETLKKIGIDCSGFVSRVLHSGGLLSAPVTTAGLPGELQKGSGRFVTVYDRANGGDAHTIMEVLGHWFESGGNRRFNPRGGVTELSAKQAAGELAGGGFVAYHPGGALNAPAKYVPGMQHYSPGGGGTSIDTLVNQYLGTVSQAAQNLAGSYQSGAQSGTVKQLEKLLGVSTGSGSGKGLSAALVGAQGPMDIAGALGASMKGSGADKSFQQLVSTLRATHSAALASLANQLVQSHRDALDALSRELLAEQATKDAETLNLQATRVRDETQAQQNYFDAALNIQKAQAQQQINVLTAATQAMKDAVQEAADRLAGAAQQIADATQGVQDKAAGAVQQIQDATQIRVDILGERGLYGLALLAQKQQVALDIMKQGFDAQIAAAQATVDMTKGQWDATISQDQILLDQVSVAQNAAVALAQQNDDTVQVAQLARIAAAQAHLDAVTLHYDTAVVGPAQMAVDMNAAAPRAVQDLLGARLKEAQARAGDAEGQASARYSETLRSAQGLIELAHEGLAGAQAQAAQLIGQAQGVIAIAQGQAQVAIGQAQLGLATIQGKAGVAEAGAQGTVQTTQALGQTQYAGTGWTVQIYGMNLQDPRAVADAVGWQLRGLIPVV